MNIVYLSLGSNRGDRRDLLRRAVALIGEKIGGVSAQSPVYETSPWGFEDPVPFYNCALEVRSALAPGEMLNAIVEIERSLGRNRGEERPAASGKGPYLPRTIDIDILFCDDLVMDSEDLVIPHPSISRRRFVLEPLSRICPGFVHPVLKIPVSELLKACPDPSEVRQVNPA